ncbi:MAG: hypC [Anaerosporomusa subterranea]|jgi:hydrogenase expression/formation protein HypC|nr:hypC [Anaerosporomusa subterranea]
MCLGVPALVTDVSDGMATVETAGVVRQVSSLLLPGLQLGEWVLVHAGFAMQTIDQRAVTEILTVYQGWAESGS